MKINKDIIPYLTGDEFSNYFPFQISEPEKIITSRFKLLEDIVKGKNIIHLGCCDHIPLIENKIKTNTWLHARIDKMANECLGIDNNENGVEYLKTQLNYKKIIYADITKDEIIQLKEKKWDYIILGELLEHIDNPVTFLSIIREKYKNYINEIIITVPNALHYQNFNNAKKHYEYINSDHRFWFTPYTLGKILNKAGFIIKEFCFTQEISKKIGLRVKFKIFPYFKRKIEYYRLLKYPALRTNLMMISKFQ